MRLSDEVLDDSAEELFEDAPCGYVTTDLSGTIVRVNRTFEAWTGLGREQLLGQRRFQDLLGPGGRIYYETHYAPLLRMQGWVREIAVDVVRADGTRLPALVNSVVRTDASGAPRAIRTTVFDATDRRRYEQELVRARDREHEIAERLQRSLLDGAFPRHPRLELGLSYVPSDEGLRVGGDWYDAFWVSDRSIGLVVGDVVGRGIEAAATMGQLRSAIRALAATGLGPAALLEALDGYAQRHGVGQMATVAYVQMDVEDGTACVACAGHMPPAIVAPGRDPWFVLDGRSVPLDVHAKPTARAQAEVVVPDEARLVLFTDGLVERVDRPLSDGLDAVLAELDARRDLPAQVLADELTEAMLADRRTKDDVCLLSVRRPAAGSGVMKGDVQS
jgi:sigma-B regulation protein RsbU (phosphoserine phosphatase)